MYARHASDDREQPEQRFTWRGLQRVDVSKAMPTTNSAGTTGQPQAR